MARFGASCSRSPTLTLAQPGGLTAGSHADPPDRQHPRQLLCRLDGSGKRTPQRATLHISC